MLGLRLISSGLLAATADSFVMLNLFYEEPEGDRWLPFDRYPRRIVRRLWRGPPQAGGHRRIFLNLRAGLDRIGIRYRVNDYRHVARNPAELACIVGQCHLLDRMDWKNPILFGAAVFAHPGDDPELFDRRPVKKILLPGAWMKEMWKPYWDDAVAVWPVGVDTDRWHDPDTTPKRFDVLLYDKVRWDHERYESVLMEPIRRKLREAGRSFREIRYGFYREEQFKTALAECRAMIFLCEHETQGIAYLQALSCDVPILAWDRGGYWQDPAYYPQKVRFAPVTSVPYWDSRCGRTFQSIEQFGDAWDLFWDEVQSDRFRPRHYVLDHLTLEKAARQYLQHVRSVADECGAA